MADRNPENLLLYIYNIRLLILLVLRKIMILKPPSPLFFNPSFNFFLKKKDKSKGEKINRELHDDSMVNNPFCLEKWVGKIRAPRCKRGIDGGG